MQYSAPGGSFRYFCLLLSLLTKVGRARKRETLFTEKEKQDTEISVSCLFGKIKLPLALVVGDTLRLGGAGLLGGEGQHHQRNDVGHHVVDGAGDIHGHQEIEAEIDIG